MREVQHPAGDIEIVITGLRPSEKLYEELLIGDNQQPTDHQRIMKAQEDFLPYSLLKDKLFQLKCLINENDVIGIRNMLKELITGFHPQPELVDWVHLHQSESFVGSQTRG